MGGHGVAPMPYRVIHNLVEVGDQEVSVTQGRPVCAVPTLGCNPCPRWGRRARASPASRERAWLGNRTKKIRRPSSDRKASGHLEARIRSGGATDCSHGWSEDRRRRPERNPWNRMYGIHFAPAGRTDVGVQGFILDNEDGETSRFVRPIRGGVTKVRLFHGLRCVRWRELAPPVATIVDPFGVASCAVPTPGCNPRPR